MKAAIALLLATLALPARAEDRFKATVGHAPSRGPADARVTIVVFAGYDCPFCAAELPVLDRLLEKYPRDVRLVWRQWPTWKKPEDVLASEAALAAREQGKFWPMQALLFGHQQPMTRAGYDHYASQLGLDAAKFDAALDRHTFVKELEEDTKDIVKLGGNSTPTMFVNGRLLRGFQTFQAMVALVDEEIAYADSLIGRGTPRAKVYQRILADARNFGASEDEDDTIVKVEVGDSPVRGPAAARVTIVEFGDFQCPFCSRVEPVLAELRKIYGNKIRIVWKDLPMMMHPQAQLAAEAARVAGEQGKFWPMHDRLLAHQDALDLTSIEKAAQALGLDMNRFRRTLDEGSYRERLETDADSYRRDFQITGTPTFFINGRRLTGAQPIERFRDLIDQALK